MRRGITPIVGSLLAILMVLTVGAAFFYWFTAGQEDAQSKTEHFQRELAGDIISRASAAIDAYYTVNREVNINNFAEFKTRIAAGDVEINLDPKDISFQLYRGYQTESDIICALSDFSGGCETDETVLIAALGGSSADEKAGLYFARSTDGSTWSTLNISSAYDIYKNFTFTYLDGFVEGGNNLTEPTNILALGEGIFCEDSPCVIETRPVQVIFDQNLKGVHYKVTHSTLAPGVFYDAVTLNDTVSVALYRSGSTGSTLAPQDVALVRQFTIYDVPQIVYPGPGGLDGLNRITTIEPILRGAELATQLIMGVDNNAGTAYIKETEEIVVGQINPYLTCPYDLSSFQDCGLTVDIKKCISGEGVVNVSEVVDIVSAYGFSDLSSKANSYPLFFAVNDFQKDDGSSPAELFYTSYSSTESTVISCANLGFTNEELDINDIKYNPSLNMVHVLMSSGAASIAQAWNVTEISADSYIAAQVGGIDIPGITSANSIEYFDNHIYIGGNGAAIVRYNNSGFTEVYSNTTKSSVQEIKVFNKCTVRKPYCKDGCNRIVPPRGELDFTLSIQNSSCDISSYSPGQQFTARISIGKNFQMIQSFEKSTGISSEVNATSI